MKHRMSPHSLAGLLIAGAALALSPLASAAEGCSGNIDPAAVERAEDARYAAQTTLDYGALDRLLGDDLVYIHSTAAVDGKATYIQSMKSGRTRYRVMRRSDTQLRLFGCLGVLTGQGNFEVTVEGKDISVALRFTSIWAQRGERLEFVSWNSTRLPPKP